jgi:SSS family solute:Na+ symporter
VPVLAGLYLRRVLSVAALSSIFAALAATLVAMRVTHGAGVGVLSPQAIGILTAAVVMALFRVFAPVLPKRTSQGTVERTML